MSEKTLGDEVHEENEQAAYKREIARRGRETITELDYALNCAAVEIDTTNARAELAQLRAKAAELDRIADLVDPLHAYDTPLYDQISNALHDDSTAELATMELRAAAAECARWRAWKPSNDKYIERLENHYVSTANELQSALARVTELEAANAALAEKLDRLQDGMSDMRAAIESEMDKCDDCGCPLISDVLEDNESFSGPYCPKCEIDQMRIDYTALEVAHDALAQQLEQARIIFENIFKRDWSNGKINDEARAWLAANAPAETTREA